MSVYALNARTGGLSIGQLLVHDCSITQEEYNKLFEYAPEHRTSALAALRAEAQIRPLLVKRQEAFTQLEAAWAAEAEAEDAAAWHSATAASPSATPEELEALATAASNARKAFFAAGCARGAAKDALAELDEQLAPLQALIAACPPKR